MRLTKAMLIEVEADLSNGNNYATVRVGTLAALLTERARDKAALEAADALVLLLGDDSRCDYMEVDGALYEYRKARGRRSRARGGR